MNSEKEFLDSFLGFEPSRGALRRYWSDVANALLFLQMRRTHTATILDQDWARMGNTFPYFSPARARWANSEKWNGDLMV